MPIGKKDESAHCGTQKAPEVATPGLFYSVVARWLYGIAVDLDGVEMEQLRDVFHQMKHDFLPQ